MFGEGDLGGLLGGRFKQVSTCSKTCSTGGGGGVITTSVLLKGIFCSITDTTDSGLDITDSTREALDSVIEMIEGDL